MANADLAIMRTRVSLAKMQFEWTKTRLRGSPVPHIIATETCILGDLTRRRLAGEDVVAELCEQSERFKCFW